MIWVWLDHITGKSSLVASGYGTLSKGSFFKIGYTQHCARVHIMNASDSVQLMFSLLSLFHTERLRWCVYATVEAELCIVLSFLKQKC